MNFILLQHYRKTDSCLVSRSLPSARPRALGKDVVCRVPGRGHSAKTRHTACPCVAECRPSATSYTRQRLIFAVCWPGGTRQSPSTCPARALTVSHPLAWLTALTLCRVPLPGTRQSPNFAKCLHAALGKSTFAECLGSSTRQTLLKKKFGLQIFLFST